MNAVLVNEDYLQGLGWKAVGNTWYPPESALPLGYKSDLPLIYWVRVDGTARIPGTYWKSGRDITQQQLCQLLAGLGIGGDSQELSLYRWMLAAGLHLSENSALCAPRWAALDVDGEICGQGDEPIEAMRAAFQLSGVPSTERREESEASDE